MSIGKNLCSIKHTNIIIIAKLGLESESKAKQNKKAIIYTINSLLKVFDIKTSQVNFARKLKLKKNLFSFFFFFFSGLPMIISKVSQFGT